MMKKAHIDQIECSLARALAQVGDSWTLLIVKEIMLGNRRFDGIHKQTGMSSLSLSSRLLALETARIIRRAPYSERPRRFEYLVTGKGRSLWPALVALTQWGDQWASGGSIPLRIEHNDCPYRGRPTFCCSGCGEPMAEGDATTVMSMRMKKDREARGNLQAH
jgi:DNA-binding HxlR family transcriptional regulator